MITVDSTITNDRHFRTMSIIRIHFSLNAMTKERMEYATRNRLLLTYTPQKHIVVRAYTPATTFTVRSTQHADKTHLTYADALKSP